MGLQVDVEDAEGDAHLSPKLKRLGNGHGLLGVVLRGSSTGRVIAVYVGGSRRQAEGQEASFLGQGNGGEVGVCGERIGEASNAKGSGEDRRDGCIGDVGTRGGIGEGSTRVTAWSPT